MSEAHFSSISTSTALTRRRRASSPGTEEDQKTAWGAVFPTKADLDRAPFEFLLDGALDRGEGRPGNAPVARFSPERAEPRMGAQPFAMVLGQRENGEAFRDVLLEPCGQPRLAVAIAGDQLGQGGFGLGEIVRRPDRFQLLADALADFGIRRVMDGVAGEVVRRIRKQRGALFSRRTAALPCGTIEDDEPSCAIGSSSCQWWRHWFEPHWRWRMRAARRPAWSSETMKSTPRRPRATRLSRSKEDQKTVRGTVFPTNAPVDLGLRQGHRGGPGFSTGSVPRSALA